MVCANLAFRRSVLEEIGGFDIVFGYGAHFAGDVDAVIEDLDAAARASAAGWAGAYDPDVVVRHHHGRKPGPEIEKLRHGYDVGRGAFYGKAALDSSLRKTYLVGWARLTAGRVRRRESPRIVARELSGATRYLAKRLRRLSRTRRARAVMGSATVARCLSRHRLPTCPRSRPRDRVRAGTPRLARLRRPAARPASSSSAASSTGFARRFRTV